MHLASCLLAPLGTSGSRGRSCTPPHQLSHLLSSVVHATILLHIPRKTNSISISHWDNCNKEMCPHEIAKVCVPSMVALSKHHSELYHHSLVIMERIAQINTPNSTQLMTKPRRPMISGPLPHRLSQHSKYDNI